ncbi:restriction endonuclease [Bradyrhizobium sp. 930_D9_N1_4]|uniref:restriction endonuclease n=1 Tax=Bradyrhizobium sp. 930_D9_N1_4 TaxID=3240374 RepID=UPI003F8C99ED
MTAKRKGDILEDLVAMMHEVPGVVVEKRKKLPVLRSKTGRRREIDVLITSRVAGYPVRLAISCKNEAKPLNTMAVDSFIRILEEVGIPVQQGILVSAKGYTSDAQDAAKSRGIKTLVFEGLSVDRLRQEISAAIQSMVFLLITQTAFSVLPYVEERFDDNPQFINAALDLMDEPSATQLLSCMAWLWMNGAIPPAIGVHIINLKPEREEATWHVIATATVTGLIASVPGTFSQVILKNAEARQVERLHISAKFEEIKGPLTLETVTSEEALSAIVHKEPMSLVTRIRVPRLVTDLGYWPPSEEALQRAKALFEAGKPVTFEDIESSNLVDAWRFGKGRK